MELGLLGSWPSWSSLQAGAVGYLTALHPWGTIAAGGLLGLFLLGALEQSITSRKRGG